MTNCSEKGYSYGMMAVPKRSIRSKSRSQYAKKKNTMKRKTVMKMKTRSQYAKKARKTRSDKGVKRGPRKSMSM
jgi:hypothetical protein